MKKITVNGTIINNNHQRIYDWLGLEATSPSKVIGSLPSNKTPIEVVINSSGGDVFAGSEIFTALKEYEGEITVKIPSIAASAASVIAMAGDKVLISPTAQIMIHNVSTYGSGDYRDFEHTAKVLKSANQAIANAYKAKTGKTDDELKELMDDETWFNAQTAVEHGFADEIMNFKSEQEPNTFVASFGTAMLNDDAIEKIMSLIEEQPAAKENQGNEFHARLKLLQLKGQATEFNI